jgi:hypothetical protein
VTTGSEGEDDLRSFDSASLESYGRQIRCVGIFHFAKILCKKAPRQENHLSSILILSRAPILATVAVRSAASE